MYTVVIRQYEDDEIINEIPCQGAIRNAERVERGVNINLNHEEYYTEIIEK